MSARGVFIAGSHTDVGKTHVACAVIRAARSRGLAVDALKPVASGFDAADWTDSDPGRLLVALGRAATSTELAAITPWRFKAPLAPPMAAAGEGRSLPFPPILEFCRGGLADSGADLMLVEGVGGLMSPLADRATSLDLAMALGLPTVLVGGGYLGAISHTLTALEVLRSRGLTVTAIVVSQDSNPAAPDFHETLALTAGHAAPTPVLPAPRGPSHDWAHAVLAQVA